MDQFDGGRDPRAQMAQAYSNGANKSVHQAAKMASTLNGSQTHTSATGLAEHNLKNPDQFKGLID
jgi:hypothetical protein